MRYRDDTGRIWDEEEIRIEFEKMEDRDEYGDFQEFIWLNRYQNGGVLELVEEDEED